MLPAISAFFQRVGNCVIYNLACLCADVAEQAAQEEEASAPQGGACGEGTGCKGRSGGSSAPSPRYHDLFCH